MNKPIYVLNGPNLNLLGVREPEIYGHSTLEDVERLCALHANNAKFNIVFAQTNNEGDLISLIQETRLMASGLVINAASLTHTSIGIYDALKSLDIPIIEVHLSNPHAREEFRHKSFVSPVAKGVIAGLGINSYRFAIEGLIAILNG